MGKKVLSKEVSDELCDLMSGIKLRADTSSIHVSSSAGNVFKDSFVTDGNLSRGDLSRDDIENNMAEVWVDIEDDEEVLFAIIDDELLELDKVDASNGTDDDYYDDEEDEIIEVVGKVKKKHTHQDIIGAFDMIQSFMEEEKLPLERRLTLDRLRYDVQMHQMQKPKASLTIRNFFQPLRKV